MLPLLFLEQKLQLRPKYLVGRISPPPRMWNRVKCRFKSYFVDTFCSIGLIKEVVHSLYKYNLSHFIDWYHTGVFCPTKNGKTLTMKKRIQGKKNKYQTDIAVSHESISKNVSAFAEITFGTFWSINFEYPDLVSKQNLQLGKCHFLPGGGAFGSFLSFVNFY